MQARLEASDDVTEKLQQLREAVGEKTTFPFDTALTLQWDKRAHTLTIAHEDARLGQIANADDIARALFAMYLDKDTTSGNIRDDFVHGLHHQFGSKI